MNWRNFDVHVMSTNKKNRIEWIDYLKAFACLLVVLGHLIQSLQKANIDKWNNTTSFINWFIYLFHMPLFMCISGFLYCKKKKIFSWNEYKVFELKKIVNLLVPYFTFYLIYVGINMLFSSSVNTPRGLGDLERIINNPIAPYWFLYALLSIFIVIPLLEKMCKSDRRIVFWILILLKIISFFISTKVYFIDSIMAYGIYFYIGSLIKEEKNKSIIVGIFEVVIYIILAFIGYTFKDNINLIIMEIIYFVFACFGIFICIDIFKYVKSSKILDTFKEYTFQIYVLHTIFAAGIRIILLKFGITNYFVQFILGMFFSIYVPVFISKVSNKILYTNFFFYPLKTIKEIKERKSAF